MIDAVSQRFKGKAVVVTGGTSGIGLATARRLLREGATVIVTHSREASRASAEPELPGAEFILNDLGDPGRAVTDLATAVGDRRIDGLFLNLLSGDASFVTGSEYVVDGGVTEV